LYASLKIKNWQESYSMKNNGANGCYALAGLTQTKQYMQGDGEK
jgi:hypothetical protein